MKKLSLWIVLVLGIAGAANAQDGRRTFDLKGFDKLSVGNAFKANVSKSNSFRVIATGEQRVWSNILLTIGVVPPPEA